MDDLSMILSCTKLQENEVQPQRHKTDRFIPMRKCNSSFSDKVATSRDEDKENVRGKEIKENKLSVEEMFRSVVLSNHSQKLLTFQLPDPIGPSFDCSKYGMIQNY